MFRLNRIPMNLGKTSTLNIYLGSVADVEWPAPIRRRIHELFEDVVAKSNPFKFASVNWTSKVPKLNKHDLLVYFLSSKSQSVCKKLYAGAVLGDDGTTLIGTKGDVVSEIYMGSNQNDPKGLAHLAFHELMHNVTMLKNSLHGDPSLSMGKEKVTAKTRLNGNDVSLVAGNLTKFRKQWTGGF